MPRRTKCAGKEDQLGDGGGACARDASGRRNIAREVTFEDGDDDAGWIGFRFGVHKHADAPSR